MLVKALPRLPWQLTAALFAMVATADIEAANSNTNIGSGGTSLLQDASGKNISTLVSVSQEAARQGLSGELFLTTDKTYANISTQDIAYISCNEDDYHGNLQANSIFAEVMQSKNISGVILYSAATDYCNYTNAQPVLQTFPIYSMTSKSDSQTLYDELSKQPISSKFFVKVVKGGSGSGDANSQQNGNNNNNPAQQNPLGPSPSTAVAMIILYSITGIITALFLVIIVTGAVRAHRHPDRYGPRDVLGRPRQSRARGIGRAILDTIPIVKFGDKEPSKPADVELGSTSEARGVHAQNGETGVVNAQPGSEERRGSQAEAPRDADGEHDAMESGIAAAQPVVAGSSTSQKDASPDEGLGCSICTDDFEKGQDIRVLPCNHKFHPECVDPWLLNVSGTCPLCRVDLRPTTSRTSTETAEGSEDPDHLAPPLQSSAEDISHRRRSQFRDLLSFRSRPNASADERISALRRLREQRRNQSGDVTGGSANASTDDVVRDRRSKRMSVRLSDVFSGRRRGNAREESPRPAAEAAASSSSAAQSPPRRDGSLKPSDSNTEFPEAGSSSNSNQQQR